MSVISVETVERAAGELVIAARDVVTPLARDRARDLGVTIRVGEPSRTPVQPAPLRPTHRETREPAGRRPAMKLDGLSLAAPTQLDAFSGALYRRGAPVHAELAPYAAACFADLPDRVHGRPRAAVIGAGHVGATTTLRLVESSLFDDVTMVDIVPGLAEGLALDIWHSSGLRGFTTRVIGSDDLSAVAGVDYIVMTAGKAVTVKSFLCFSGSRSPLSVIGRRMASLSSRKTRLAPK